MHLVFTSNMGGGKKEETISNIKSVFIKASKIVYTIIVFQLSPFIINLLPYVVQFVMYFLKLKIIKHLNWKCIIYNMYAYCYIFYLFLMMQSF